MRIHYFQRYHQKENVATANTMLLLSRLYQYSPDKFYEMLGSLMELDEFEPSPVFTIQEKDELSVPDATISQEGFKIVVETKLGESFSLDQLENHLAAFTDETANKVLVTLAPRPMKEAQLERFREVLARHNRSTRHPVKHVNSTFAKVIDACADVLDERDYDMKDVLDDFREFCEHDGLVNVSGADNLMRMQLAGRTFEANVSGSVYHCHAKTKLRDFAYLGLYKDKSIRAIGKVTAVALSSCEGDELRCELVSGQPPADWVEKIEASTEAEARAGYPREDPRRFFFVERFYPTDFRKATPRAPMGGRVFDLKKVLGVDQLPDTRTIAERLSGREWS